MACPVCFGGDDPMMRESLNAGIGVLLGVTAIVLGCFARFFMTLARRSRDAAHLVETRPGWVEAPAGWIAPPSSSIDYRAPLEARGPGPHAR
jgi:hypothetical protein